MRNSIIAIILSAGLFGCADQVKRQQYLQTQYPRCKVEPASSMLQREGYDFIVVDTTGQIIAVDFYPFSETKISQLRNFR